MPVTLRDAFADFFKSPSRESLSVILADLPEERNEIDFKKDWDSWPKLAKNTIAMGNTGNGLIVHGVEQQNGLFVAVGLPELIDKANISKGIQDYLPSKLDWEIWDFCYPAEHFLSAKKYQVVAINYDPSIIPLVSFKDGAEIKRNRIYVRRQTESVEANYDEMQDVIRRRIASSSISARKLAEHLEELRALYQSMNKYISMNEMMAGILASDKNPRYPAEDFDSFVLRMIEHKKKVVQAML